MNKNFLKSVAAGVMGLSLVASCSMLKKESHFCGAKNGCAAKKDDANKCSSKEGEANKCSSKKDEASKSVVKKDEANKCSSNKCSAKSKK